MSCNDRYFADERSSAQYLKTHEAEFEHIAEEWNSSAANHISIFCNFSAGNYRWENTFIRETNDGFSVETDQGKKNAKSLEDAAMVAGISYAALSHWMDVTTRDNIYCLRDGDNSTVELLLKGSEWSPYGFRYAPKGNPAALHFLENAVSVGRVDNTDTKMKYLSGRWFYFEAKR
jgi:hypothetical protein